MDDFLAENVALSDADLAEIREAGRHDSTWLKAIHTPFGTAVKADGKWFVLAPRHAVWDGIRG